MNWISLIEAALCNGLLRADPGSLESLRSICKAPEHDAGHDEPDEGNSGSRVTLEVLGKATAAAGFQSSSEIAEVSGNKSGNDISY